jgi:hypothetical protein
MRLHLLVTFSLLGLSVADTHLRVLHRLYNPVTGASSAFAERGTLTSSESVTAAWVFNPSPTTAQDWKRYPELLRDLDLGQALYEVALERPSDENEAHWAISSVKAVRPRTPPSGFPISVAVLTLAWTFLVPSARKRIRHPRCTCHRHTRAFRHRLFRGAHPPRRGLSEILDIGPIPKWPS